MHFFVYVGIENHFPKLTHVNFHTQLDTTFWRRSILDQDPGQGFHEREADEREPIK